MTQYVWAPDMMSSYFYATGASRMSRLIASSDPALAKTYRESALKAMAWAEKDRSRRKAAGTLGKLSWTVKDDRNFAAISLYQLTGDPKWHAVFKEDTVLTAAEPNLYAWTVANQRDAAFAYARLSLKLADPELKRKAILAIERQAKIALDYAAGNSFNLTTSDPGQPMFLGFYSVPTPLRCPGRTI
jgi:endoglucanase